MWKETCRWREFRSNNQTKCGNSLIHHLHLNLPQALCLMDSCSRENGRLGLIGYWLTTFRQGRQWITHWKNGGEALDTKTGGNTHSLSIYLYSWVINDAGGDAWLGLRFVRLCLFVDVLMRAWMWCRSVMLELEMVKFVFVWKRDRAQRKT